MSTPQRVVAHMLLSSATGGPTSALAGISHLGMVATGRGMLNWNETVSVVVQGTVQRSTLNLPPKTASSIELASSRTAPGIFLWTGQPTRARVSLVQCGAVTKGEAARAVTKARGRKDCSRSVEASAARRRQSWGGEHAPRTSRSQSRQTRRHCSSGRSCRCGTPA